MKLMKTTLLSFWTGFFLLLGCVACDGGEGEGEGEGDPVVVFDGDPATVRLAGACELAERHGGFGVFEQEDFSFVSGDVKNGVLPITVLEEIDAEGDCRLLRRNNPFCAPTCTAGTTCNFDGECIAFPTALDVGTTYVDGLVAPVSMNATPPGNTYFDTSIPHVPYDDGVALRLRMTTPPLELFGVAVKALDADPAWDLSRGDDLSVTWNAPAENSRSNVEVRMSVDQHGTTPATLVCIFADTGSAVVPASMVDALLDQGVTGFPNGSIQRQTVDSVAHDGGCVDFTVASTRVADITVAAP